MTHSPDTEAGQRSGVASILVGTGYGVELHKEQQENGEKHADPLCRCTGTGSTMDYWKKWKIKT